MSRIEKIWQTFFRQIDDINQFPYYYIFTPILTLFCIEEASFLNPIPTGHGRNQPIYERHVTNAGRNRVNNEYHIIKIGKNLFSRLPRLGSV